MHTQTYERILHGELVAMQEWVKDSGTKICVVFEGRDSAGKGGTIKRITERDAMFAATDTAWVPWYVADADDKKRARLNIISHLLSQVPYKPLPHRDITLPERQPRSGYREPDLPWRRIVAPC